MNNSFSLQELRYLESVIASEYVKDEVVCSAYNKICKLIDNAQDWIDAEKVQFKWVGPDQYTLDILNQAPYGTVITFTYNACSNVRVQCSTPPTTLLSLFKRASYKDCSSAVEPVCIAIKLNKKMIDLLRSNVIPNQLRLTETGLTASFNTQTEVLFLDDGMRNIGEL